MRYGRHDRALISTMLIIAAGVLAYRLLPLTQRPTPPHAGLIMAPIVTTLIVVAVTIFARRSTLLARHRDALCARCETPMPRDEHGAVRLGVCPNCGANNAAIARRWRLASQLP